MPFSVIKAVDSHPDNPGLIIIKTYMSGTRKGIQTNVPFKKVCNQKVSPS